MNCVIEIDEDSCFLCQSKLGTNGKVCEHCQEAIKYCCDDHYAVHRGSIRRRGGGGKKDESDSCGIDNPGSSSGRNQDSGGVCWPFRIGRHAVKGNVMVASRDVRAGETILEEHPAVWGPNVKTTPVCVECLSSQPRTEEMVSKDGLNKEKIVTSTCSKCGFPVCGTECKY